MYSLYTVIEKLIL